MAIDCWQSGGWSSRCSRPLAIRGERIVGALLRGLLFGYEKRRRVVLGSSRYLGWIRWHLGLGADHGGNPGAHQSTDGEPPGKSESNLLFDRRGRVWSRRRFGLQFEPRQRRQSIVHVL